MAVATQRHPVADSVVHHWQQGPADVKKVKPYKHHGFRVTHEFRFYVDRVEGVGRKFFLRRLYQVFHDQRSWCRSGVRWIRTMDPAKAQILLRVVPDGHTVCGPGAAGCYSWGGGKPPAAEIEAQYVSDDGMFPRLVWMELAGHGTFRMFDHYAGSGHDASAYHGVMGNGQDPLHASHSWPTDREIEWSKRWLKGETPPEYVHAH